MSNHGDDKRLMDLDLATFLVASYVIVDALYQSVSPRMPAYGGPPAQMSDGEVLLRAFAEASGLETRVAFRFPARGKKGVQIDVVKPGDVEQ